MFPREPEPPPQPFVLTSHQAKDPSWFPSLRTKQGLDWPGTGAGEAGPCLEEPLLAPAGTLSTKCQALLGPRPPSDQAGPNLQEVGFKAGQARVRQEGLGWGRDRHSQLCGCPGSPCAPSSSCLASLECQP